MVRSAPDNDFLSSRILDLPDIRKKFGQIPDVLLNVVNMNIILILTMKLYDIIIYLQR